MTEEKKGIKETQELIAGLTEAVKLGKGVRDLIKVGFSVASFPHVFEIIKEQSEKFGVYEAALKDVKLVKEELKDLDKEEILVLIFALVDAVEQIEKA
jgi:DNA primase large subunit